MKPSRRTQPFRRGARTPGAALAAALRGRTAAGVNPQDMQRALEKRARTALGRGVARRLKR